MSVRDMVSSRSSDLLQLGYLQLELLVVYLHAAHGPRGGRTARRVWLLHAGKIPDSWSTSRDTLVTSPEFQGISVRAYEDLSVAHQNCLRLGTAMLKAMIAQPT